jgi:hypothetical protein
MAVPAAYPFIEVKIDTSGLQPIATRSPGVIAVVGIGAGTNPTNTAIEIDTTGDAAGFAAVVNNVPTPNALYNSLLLALLQDPKPSKIYGVKTAGNAGTDWDAALGALDAVDDVDFVSLANITDVTLLGKVKTHAENNSANGQKRIAVGMIDPTTAKSATYVTDVTTAAQPLLSSVSRMVLVGLRGAVQNAASVDIATAAMAAIAGYPPQTSIVLKQIRGFDNLGIAQSLLYSSSEIKQLSEAGIIPLIRPSLIVGGGFYFGEGRTFTTDAQLLYVDIVRVLDDIDFRLKAGLIGLIGDARITRAGLTTVKTRIDGILGPLVRSAEIDEFQVQIPVLDILSLPDSARSATENALVATARQNRAVDVIVTVTYGPAVHRLLVTLNVTF